MPAARVCIRSATRTYLESDRVGCQRLVGWTYRELEDGPDRRCERSHEGSCSGVEPKTPRLRSTGGRTDAHTAIKIMEFLHDKPKQTLSIVAETGDPDAYSDMQRLREAFDGSGWIVNTGTGDFGGPGLFSLTNSQTPRSTFAIVSEALASNGLSFRHRRRDSEEFTTCTIYISNRTS